MQVVDQKGGNVFLKEKVRGRFGRKLLKTQGRECFASTKESVLAMKE